VFFAIILCQYTRLETYMSLVMKVAATLLGTMAVVACASPPPKAVAPAVASVPASAAPGTTAGAPAADAAPAQVNPKLVSQGYKAVKYQGAYVYCRSEPVTGTQFQKKVCLTEAAIKDIEAKTQETVDGMTKQRSGPSCFPGINC
jgi:hypothetical protein